MQYTVIVLSVAIMTENIRVYFYKSKCVRVKINEDQIKTTLWSESDLNSYLAKAELFSWIGQLLWFLLRLNTIKLLYCYTVNMDIVFANIVLILVKQTENKWTQKSHHASSEDRATSFSHFIITCQQRWLSAVIFRAMCVNVDSLV